MESVKNIKKMLQNTDCPFNWSYPKIDIPVDKFLISQNEKLTNVDEDSFQWTRCTINLLLAYELCEKMKDFDKSLEHIKSVEEHLESLTKEGCQEALFCSVRTALTHVTMATKAYILLFCGREQEAAQVATKIKPLILENAKENAAVLGIKAAIYILYGAVGHRMALQLAKAARDLDPEQAEWSFLVSNAMGRIRRAEHSKISAEEINAIEKASQLNKNAAYTVHLAQVYQDYSSEFFFDHNRVNRQENMEKCKCYAVKAIALYKKALELRPNCASLMARVAHGMIRIRIKEMLDIKFTKQLLDNVINKQPNNVMVYEDLAYYYDRFENNTEKAIANLKKAVELGNMSAFSYMISLKWKHGLKTEIIDDLKEEVARYPSDNKQLKLLTHLAVCCVIIVDDWEEAMSYFIKALKLEKAAEFMENYQSLKDGSRKINLLEMITNEVRLKVAYSRSLPVFQMFLELVKSVRPDIFLREPRSGVFENWKTDQLKVNSNKRFTTQLKRSF